MMRFPARLTAKLAKVRIAQIFNFAPAHSLIHCVNTADVLHPGSDAPVSCEKMQRLIANPSPVIWIGDNESLLHAGIGHFVRAIAQSGHFVFLETDGTFLRRRMHEFQPLPELFLTVRIESQQAPEFALVVEGLRAGRHSGFFTVIHSPIHEDSDVAQLTTLRGFIAENDVDGWVITAGSTDQAVVGKAAAARSLISSGFWRRFSGHVEEALLARTQGRELRDASASVAASSRAETHEEGVGVA